MEDGDHEKKFGGEGDYFGVIVVKGSNEIFSKATEERGEGGEEESDDPSGEDDGRIALFLLSAGSISHAHGERDGEAERNHEERASGSEGDLVRGEGDFAVEADEKTRGGEGTDFGQKMEAGRNAESEEFAESGGVRSSEPAVRSELLKRF